MTPKIGKCFTALDARKAVKREVRMRANLIRLALDGVAYEAPHTTHHVVIKAGRHTIDYRPATDRWQVRGETVLRHGVWKLIEFVQACGSQPTHIYRRGEGRD